MASTDAMADAVVRFIHGVPGVGSADVSIQGAGGKTDLGAISFAQATPWRSIHSGTFHWSLTGGSKTLASGTASVGNGAYDVVVLLRSGKVWLGFYKSQGGTPGTATVRVIHGAPELGSPVVEVDNKPVAAHLAYTVATPYLTLTPGKHNFSAMRPGSTAPLLSVTGATLQSGVAYSAVVLGTRGQMTRVLLLADRGAPGIKPASATTPPKNGQPPAAGGPGGGSGDTVTIRTGDCLWMIAQDVVGKDASGEQVQQEVVRIWKANADRIGTGDPDLVYPGVKLRIPKP